MRINHRVNMNNSFINSIISIIAKRNVTQMYGQLNTALLHSCVCSLSKALPEAGRLYVCIAAKEAVILMIDDYQGDELASEAPFNNEGLPLYFSETSSRISPAFRLYAVTEALREYLEGKVKTFASVLITTSNIINEDDIKSIWKNMRVSVRMVKKLDGLSIASDKLPEFLKGFADVYNGIKAIESHVDIEEYGKIIDGATQLHFEDTKVNAETREQPLFLEVDVESIIDKEDPVYHCLQSDGTSSYLRGNLPPVKVYAPINNPDAILERMVGLNEIKEHIRRIRNLSLFRAKLQARNIHVKLPSISLHTCLLGNPGTGKSTVALLFASLLHSAGILSKGNVIVANRASFLSRWVGSEERNVAMLLAMSKGSVLMIDEAHNLMLGANSADYSRNVMPIMMTALADESNRDFAVLLCGYEKEMDKAMQTDPGIKSRFPNRFVFEDYNVDQLHEMAVNRIASGGYILEDSVSELIYDLLKNMYDNRTPDSWANAREVSTLWEEIMIRHAERCIIQGVTGNRALITITSDDIPEYKPTVAKVRTKIGFC